MDSDDEERKRQLRWRKELQAAATVWWPDPLLVALQRPPETMWVAGYVAPEEPTNAE